jgi:hypothetical protein
VTSAAAGNDANAGENDVYAFQARFIFTSVQGHFFPDFDRKSTWVGAVDRNARITFAAA